MTRDRVQELGIASRVERESGEWSQNSPTDPHVYPDRTGVATNAGGHDG